MPGGALRQSLVARAQSRAGLILLAISTATFAVHVTAFEILHPPPGLAGRNGISAALGLLNGRGYTVCGEEVVAIRKAAPGTNLLELYAPDAPRTRAQEPLPFLILLDWTLAKATGSLSYRMLAWLQVAVHALAVLLLGRELMRVNVLAGLLAAAAWGGWLPLVRVSTSVGYDVLCGSFSLFVAVACLAALRRGSWRLMLVAGVLAGAGLWLRSYFLLLPAVLGVVLLLAPVTWRQRLAFAVPVLVLFIALAGLRSGQQTQSRVTRGGFWHTFWAGVGQFENDAGVINDDLSVRDLAERLAGQSFRQHDFQYDPAYDGALHDLARTWIPQHRFELVRNTAYRLGWLVVPGAMPVKDIRVRVGLSVVTGLVTVLAVVGAVALWRARRWYAVVLSTPWLSLAPLAAFYLIAKVPTTVYFVPLAFAAFGAAYLLGSRDFANDGTHGN